MLARSRQSARCWTSGATSCQSTDCSPASSAARTRVDQAAQACPRSRTARAAAPTPTPPAHHHQPTPSTLPAAPAPGSPNTPPAAPATHDTRPDFHASNANANAAIWVHRGSSSNPNRFSRSTASCAAAGQSLLLGPHPPQHPERRHQEVARPATRVHHRHLSRPLRPLLERPRRRHPLLVNRRILPVLAPGRVRMPGRPPRPQRVLQQEPHHVILGEQLRHRRQIRPTDLPLRPVHLILTPRLPVLIHPPQRVIRREHLRRQPLQQSLQPLPRPPPATATPTHGSSTRKIPGNIAAANRAATSHRSGSPISAATSATLIHRHRLPRHVMQPTTRSPPKTAQTTSDATAQTPPQPPEPPPTPTAAPAPSTHAATPDPTPTTPPAPDPPPHPTTPPETHTQPPPPHAPQPPPPPTTAAHPTTTTTHEMPPLTLNADGAAGVELAADERPNALDVGVGLFRVSMTAPGSDSGTAFGANRWTSSSLAAAPAPAAARHRLLHHLERVLAQLLQQCGVAGDARLGRWSEPMLPLEVLLSGRSSLSQCGGTGELLGLCLNGRRGPVRGARGSGPSALTGLGQ